MSQLVIGLTGGIASGKTTVAELFRQFGIDIIDADIIARQVVEPGTTGLAAIVEKFGQHILTPQGDLNRSALRDLVFSDPGHKAWLNGLLHPQIREQMLAQIQQAQSAYCLLVVPLLIENRLQNLVDRVLVVDVPTAEQIARTVERDRVSPQQAQAIVAAQASRDQRLAAADEVIQNHGSIKELTLEVKKLHDKYSQLAG